ncbi:MAG TPA: chromate transporter [Patescibacteria group bacterium]|nr:chromate transporter [Patescibacteria group bacterium]
MKKKMSYGKLFSIFLAAGWAFGGGLGVIFEMEKQLVHKHHFLSKKEFMSLFAIGRVVPSGTVTAIAIAVGYKYKGLLGTLVALLGVMIPGFTITLILAALYTVFKQNNYFEIINASIMPAAVGLIFLAAVNMGKDVFHSPLLIAFALAAFLATMLGMSVTLVIGLGALLGIVLFSQIKEGHDLPY